MPCLRVQVGISNKMNVHNQTSAVLLKGKVTVTAPNMPESTTIPGRTLLPFMMASDVPRGLLHAAAAALEFAFMLIAM